jgi:hypothetical protein
MSICFHSKFIENIHLINRKLPLECEFVDSRTVEFQGTSAESLKYEWTHFS